MSGPHALVLRGDATANENGTRPGGGGLEDWWNTLTALSRDDPTDETLVQAVTTNFDLFDEDARTTLAVRVAAEAERKQSVGETAYAKIAAAVQFVTTRKLEEAGQRLKQMIAIARGDVRALLAMADSYQRKGLLDRVFLEALRANIDFAERNSQPVKVQVLSMLRTHIEKAQQGNRGRREDLSTQLSPNSPSAAGDGPHPRPLTSTAADTRSDTASRLADMETEWAGQYHAPRFTAPGLGLTGTTNDPHDTTTTTRVERRVPPLASDQIRTYAGFGTQLLRAADKVGSKNAIRNRKEEIRKRGAAIQKDLQARGWVVLDEFQNLDEIRSVRAEMARVTHQYKVRTGKNPGTSSLLPLARTRTLLLTR